MELDLGNNAYDILNDWQNTSTEVYLTPILSFPVD